MQRLFVFLPRFNPSWCHSDLSTCAGCQSMSTARQTNRGRNKLWAWALISKTRSSERKWTRQGGGGDQKWLWSSDIAPQNLRLLLNIQVQDFVARLLTQVEEWVRRFLNKCIKILHDCFRAAPFCCCLPDHFSSNKAKQKQISCAHTESDESLTFHPQGSFLLYVFFGSQMALCFKLYRNKCTDACRWGLSPGGWSTVLRSQWGRCYTTVGRPAKSSEPVVPSSLCSSSSFLFLCLLVLP